MFEERTIIVTPDGSIHEGPADAAEGLREVVATVRLEDDQIAEYWERFSAAQAVLSDRMRTAVATAIDTHVPMHDQANMTATSTAMLHDTILNPDTPTAPEVKVAAEAMRAALGWIKAVRVAGRTARAAIDGAADAAGLAAIDMTLPAPPLDQITIAKAATLA